MSVDGSGTERIVLCKLVRTGLWMVELKEQDIKQDQNPVFLSLSCISRDWRVYVGADSRLATDLI